MKARESHGTNKANVDVSKRLGANRTLEGGRCRVRDRALFQIETRTAEFVVHA